MPSILPINLDNLLACRGIESARVEFKASWDEKTTGTQCLRTICAFANDFQNLNGGYIVLGVAERDGAALLPPQGLTPAELEQAQKWLRGQCNRIDPVYQPVLSPELVDGRLLLVIWAPGSQIRPHQAPDLGRQPADRKFYIRLGADTVDADGTPDLKRQLIELTAQIPFDDRRSLLANIQDIRETKVREFLHDIGSALVDDADTRSVYRHLRIAEPVNGHDAPRNVGLLFFSQDPEQWFRGTRMEVASFLDDVSGNVIDERVFAHRPIQEQLWDCLGYLESLIIRRIQKRPDQLNAGHVVNYPVAALREAVVNAVYHRAYDGVGEPIKIHIYPDRIEIISYPGPMPGIEQSHLDGRGALPPVPARNRRIGEFLKELRLAEGRGTGLPKVRRAMAENGSPSPGFDFDAARSYFRITLPVHAAFLSEL